VGKEGSATGSVDQYFRIEVLRRTIRIPHLQPDNSVTLQNRSERRCRPPESALREGRVEQDFVETTSHHVPSGGRNLHVVFVASNQSDPEFVLAVGAIKNCAVLDRVTLRFDRRTQAQLLEGDRGCACQ